jgi:N-acetylglutamate synthase-like GNAT family acetyltransferase
MVNVRAATMADQIDIRRLLRQLHPDRPETATLPRVRQQSQTFVATDESRTIGVLVATVVDYGMEAYGMIEELVVDAEHRGAGVGTALLTQCLAWFDTGRVDVVFVSAIDEQVAGFYLGAGFARCTGPWLARAGAKASAGEKGDGA